MAIFLKRKPHPLIIVYKYSVYLQTEHTAKLIKIMRDGKPTKSRLLIEAFKLFALKPYDRVTFADLEEATGLSRGAILYHIKTKENLFSDVVNKFIFERNSVSNIPEKFQSNLSHFITHFVESCQKEKNEMLDLGILNVNNAMLNIEISAFYILPEMREIANEWLYKEKNTWKIVLKNAISKKEVKDDIDIEILIDLFQNIYLGTSFAGVVHEDGYKIDQLEREFMLIYQLIKI